MQEIQAFEALHVRKNDQYNDIGQIDINLTGFQASVANNTMEKLWDCVYKHRNLRKEFSKLHSTCPEKHLGEKHIFFDKVLILYIFSDFEPKLFVRIVTTASYESM